MRRTRAGAAESGPSAELDGREWSEVRSDWCLFAILAQSPLQASAAATPPAPVPRPTSPRGRERVFHDHERTTIEGGRATAPTAAYLSQSALTSKRSKRRRRSGRAIAVQLVSDRAVAGPRLTASTVRRARSGMSRPRTHAAFSTARADATSTGDDGRDGTRTSRRWNQRLPPLPMARSADRCQPSLLRQSRDPPDHRAETGGVQAHRLRSFT